MCTAISPNGFFGRNLDREYGFQQQVVITPRNLPLIFRKAQTIHIPHAYIGMATVDHGFPLYFDGLNEQGLCIAALDFPQNAYYPQPDEGITNIAPFEFIPWILSQCGTVDEVTDLMKKTQISDISYSASFPQSPLHWLVADKNKCIVIEPMMGGIQIHHNPVGVLCNNPPFPYHLLNLTNYQHLTPGEQTASFEGINLPPYSGGMGAIGLPGDYSSPSRFVKAAFVKQHSQSSTEPTSEVTQFFHILDSVSMPKGAIRVRGGQDEITQYSCCCDMSTSM